MCCHLPHLRKLPSNPSFLRWYCRYLSSSSPQQPSIDLAFSPNFRRPRDSALLLWGCAGQWTYSRRRHSTWVPAPELGCSFRYSKIIPPSSIIKSLLLLFEISSSRVLTNLKLPFSHLYTIQPDRYCLLQLRLQQVSLYLLLFMVENKTTAACTAAEKCSRAVGKVIVLSVCIQYFSRDVLTVVLGWTHEHLHGYGK